MSHGFGWLVSFGLAVVALDGCASPGAPKSPTVPPALHQGPLTELVPAAGLRWLIVAEPKRLWSQPDVARNLERLFPSQRLDAFEKASGLDLRTLDSGVIAGFDLGILYLAQTRDHIGLAQEAFVERLVSDPIVKHLGPGVTQTTGIIGATPESFLSLEQLGIGLSVGDPTLTKIAGAFALGKLRKSPSSLEGAALSELPKHLDQEPLRFYAPGPFTGEWAAGAQGLLAQTTAVAIVANPDPSGVLRVAVTALGDYGNDVNAINRKARQSFESFAHSELGGLLGFLSPTVTHEVVTDSGQVTLTVSIPLSRLMDGLYSAVAADIQEMLEVTPKGTNDKAHEAQPPSLPPVK